MCSVSTKYVSEFAFAYSQNRNCYFSASNLKCGTNRFDNPFVGRGCDHACVGRTSAYQTSLRWLLQNVLYSYTFILIILYVTYFQGLYIDIKTYSEDEFMKIGIFNFSVSQ
jgi:hypothetical protein